MKNEVKICMKLRSHSHFINEEVVQVYEFNYFISDEVVTTSGHHHQRILALKGFSHILHT